MSGTVPRPGLPPVAALPARRDMLAPSRARVAPSLRGMARRHALVRLAKLALPAIALALLFLLLFWPDIAGTGTANPIAAVLSAAMMLEFLGEADAAARVRKACADPSVLEGSTSDIGDAIAERV